jgi:DinB superfamily
VDGRVLRPELELIRWQFDLTWSLLDLHLSGLTEQQTLWEPAPGAWTVRRQPDGRWLPDWVEPEPEPPPSSSIGWVTWHVLWWWGETVAHLTGEPVPAREDVTWPGSAAAATAAIRALGDRWVALLPTLDLGARAPFPWRDRPDRTVGHTAAWVNAELMKNTAEIGQLRLIHGS